MLETWVRPLRGEDPLEKEMATHSSILAWKMPWTEKLGRLQSMGSQSQTQLSGFTFTFISRKEKGGKKSVTPPLAKASNQYVYVGNVIMQDYSLGERNDNNINKQKHKCHV